MRKWLRHNALGLVMFVLFVICLIAQSLTGLRTHNAENEEHGEPPQSYVAYLQSGAFLEATMENWESEFLQMGMFVLLTAFLYQKGSAESKPPGETSEVDRDPRRSTRRNVPWPVRRGGWVLKIYENSLSLAFFILFAFSFALHAVGGARDYSEEEVLHGGSPVGAIEYLGTSRFWFESFQNWQSEFLSVFAMVVLSIWLRQRGSPESKPVAASHAKTGAG